MKIDQTEELKVNTKYKVCILSAGKGIRLGSLTKFLNKSLLPINHKAVISHIIEKFPEDIDIIVATGYQGEKVKEYLHHAHPNRNIVTVDVKNFEGPGSGPGLSLLACRKHLQCPFIIYAADTMILEDSLPLPDRNWMGVASIDSEDSENFCTVDIKDGKINKLFDKEKGNNTLAFIGVSGINDFNLFWKSLENDRSLINNEHQLSNGLKALVEYDYYPEKFTWKDTGTVRSYYETRNFFEKLDENFNFDKINEFTYFVNKRVIKYFGDEKNIDMRYQRSKMLSGLCPPIDKKTRWFISYRKIKGTTLYNCLNPQVTNDFLTWLQKNLWKEVKNLSEVEFSNSCQKFYKDKTLNRLREFYKKYPDYKGQNYNVNGSQVSSIETILMNIDWQSLFDGIQSNFHGDLQFDNVLKTGWLSNGKDDFKLLDWRQDFGGTVESGDIYYDLSKLYGGLTLPYHLIKKNKFSYFENEISGVTYDFETSHMLDESRTVFEKFIKNFKYDLKKIKIIRGLIFLNMAPLHENPFDKMLYHMSRYFLSGVNDENR